MKKKLSKALTWDDLANDYDKQTSDGRKARILPMDIVFDWAERQSDKYIVKEGEGTIHKIL